MRLLLVEDHALVRSALARVLRAGGWEFVGEAASVAEGLREAMGSPWDLVVIDAMLGEESGLELAVQLHGLLPRLPLMMLSMHSQPGLVREALQAGVRTFVVKEAAPEEVVAATMVARTGSMYLDARLASAYLGGASCQERSGLILEAVRQGLGNQEIAARLNLSVSSVKAELRALFHQHGVKDRHGLARVLHLTL